MNGPDPFLVIPALALALWIARMALDYVAARRWQWSIADWLWLTLFVGLAISYLSLLW
jgi:hypothetical protein